MTTRIRSIILGGVAAVACAALAGCPGGEPETPDPGAPRAPGTGLPAPDTTAGGGHDEAEVTIGTVNAGGTVLTLSSDLAFAPGAFMHLHVTHTSGPAPAAVRVWFGEADGIGVLKNKASGGTVMHVDAEIPEAILEGDELWVEVEAADGSRTAVAVPTA